jgi:hypothetical protein
MFYDVLEFNHLRICLNKRVLTLKSRGEDREVICDSNSYLIVVVGAL